MKKIIGCLVVERDLVAVLTEWWYVLEDQDDVNAEKS